MDINPLLTVKDHSVSGEQFVVWQCSKCTLRFTQDIPDKNSIGKYYQSEDYISHSDTSKGLINQVYKKVRNYTLHKKADLVISHTKRNGHILDIGAGTGAFLSTMKKKSWLVTGVEPDESARKRAVEQYSLHFSSVLNLNEPVSEGYDAITMWHVLEHVHELHAYVERLKMLLQPGGRIFIAVPNYKALDSSIYKLYWAAYDVPRHLYHFNPTSMKELMNLHGLHIIDRKPMWFDSFYISLLSSKYKNGKERWLSASWNGLRSNLNAFMNRNACSSIIYIIQKDQRSN